MSVLSDFRYGARTLLRSPGLIVIATLALGLGIGATATVWSIVYGTMLKGLPFQEQRQIVSVFRANPSKDIRRTGVTAYDFVDYRKQQRAFAKLGATNCGTMNVSGTDRAERYSGCWMTVDAMVIPRVNPIRGRLFQTGEDASGGERVAILGYGMWRDRFDRAEDVVGRIIRVNGSPYTVVGVMPEGFLYPLTAQLWIPLQVDASATTRAQSPLFQVVGRIRSGVSLDEANADLATIAKRIATDNKDSNEGMQAVVEPFIDSFIGDGRKLLAAMLGAAVFVLLIACANVANLLLDRAAHRTKEIGIRTALGASRVSIVRQFFAEALILSGLGALLGTGFAYAGIRAFNQALVASIQPPFFVDIRLQAAVILFIGGMAVLASLFSGVLPAVQSSRADINTILKDESRGASSRSIGRMSRAVVVFEVALSCGLLVGAGLMIKSVTKLRNIEPGFVTANVFTARLGFPAGSATDSVQQRLFWERLPATLAQIPGAQSASVSSGLPGASMSPQQIVPEGSTYAREQDRPRVRSLSVTPDFFRTFGIPLRQGRAFTSADRSGMPLVAVVTQGFADTHFRGADPIGRRFRIPFGRDSLAWRTVVGVVPVVFVGDNEEPWAPAIFLPFAQQPTTLASIAVKTGASPMAITPSVRGAIASLNADLPIYSVYSMEEALARATWLVRVFGTMFMIFGVVALFLAGIGLYAVMAFSVSRRTREVGIRMALGANRANVVRMILGQGMTQLGIGLGFGLALAAGVSQSLRTVMFDVQPRDPMIFGGVVAVLAAAGLLACLGPARSATAVDPLVALRSD